MGQYYLIVNLDKEQYLHPHHCGNGLKLMEFGCSDMGTMTALAVLLADGNGRGGGDLDSRSEMVGLWAGDRIVVAGDYADEGRYGIVGTLFHYAEEHFTDVSFHAMRACVDDTYIMATLKKHAKKSYLLGEMWKQIINPPALALAQKKRIEV